MWNFLSIRPDFLGCFIFFLYDERQRGTLTLNQITALIEGIHPGTIDTNIVVKKLVKKLNGKKNAHWGIDKFTDWARANPSVIQPFITIQYKLRADVVGTRFWESLTARRQMVVHLGHPRYCVNLYKRIREEEGGEGGGWGGSGARQEKVPVERKVISRSSSKIVPEASTSPSYSSLQNEQKFDYTEECVDNHTSPLVTQVGDGTLSTMQQQVNKGTAERYAEEYSEDRYDEYGHYIGHGEKEGYYYDYQSEQWIAYEDTIAHASSLTRSTNKDDDKHAISHNSDVDNAYVTTGTSSYTSVGGTPSPSGGGEGGEHARRLARGVSPVVTSHKAIGSTVTNHRATLPPLESVTTISSNKKKITKKDGMKKRKGKKTSKGGGGGGEGLTTM